MKKLFLAVAKLYMYTGIIFLIYYILGVIIRLCYTNDSILTMVIYLVIFGLPIWFCIEVYLLEGEKYPEMRKAGWI